MLILQPAAARSAISILPQEVIVDTDIGDDLDDAFALALVLSSPELKLDAVDVSLGETALRARMVKRALRQLGHADIPVAAGPTTPAGTRFTQAAWAAAEPPPATPVPDAVTVTIDLLRAAPPGRITLLALAPLTTIGAIIARDPVAFRRLAGVVVMGGSIHPGVRTIEYNVSRDPDGLRRLLAIGVPVELMPLQATMVSLPRNARSRLFAAHTPATDWLAALYPLWAHRNPWGPTPVLFDVVPVARLLQPGICTPVRLRLLVLETGVTRPVPGPPNAGVCLHVDASSVLKLVQERLAHPP